MNPPFGVQGKWIKKAYNESLKGTTVVCLMPSRTNTNWWHDYCMKGEIRFVRGRPIFKGAKHGLPQPLSIVIFRQEDIMGEARGEVHSGVLEAQFIGDERWIELEKIKRFPAETAWTLEDIKKPIKSLRIRYLKEPLTVTAKEG